MQEKSPGQLALIQESKYPFLKFVGCVHVAPKRNNNNNENSDSNTS